GDHIAYHFFAVDFIRHADGRGLENSGMLQQDLVDLRGCDVHAAPDDQILGAAGDTNKAIRVLDGEVAGLDAVGADALDRSVIQKITDRGMRAARRHLAFGAGRTWSAVSVDDGEFLVQRRDPDGTDAVLV